jgi:hypothetical protein
VITALMAVLSFAMPFRNHDCKPFPEAAPDTTDIEDFNYASVLVQFRCDNSTTYNEMASLFFNSWDDCLRLLFHLPMVGIDGIASVLVCGTKSPAAHQYRLSALGL